jgi:hypothetical protein
VWVDSSGIPSASFVAKISEGLEGRQWLVLVMTSDALASSWVRTEVETVQHRRNVPRKLSAVRPGLSTTVFQRSLWMLYAMLHGSQIKLDLRRQ